MLSKSTEKQREFHCKTRFTMYRITSSFQRHGMHAMCTSISIHTSLINMVILNSFSLVYGTYFYQSFSLC